MPRKVAKNRVSDRHTPLVLPTVYGQHSSQATVCGQQYMADTIRPHYMANTPAQATVYSGQPCIADTIRLHYMANTIWSSNCRARRAHSIGQTLHTVNSISPTLDVHTVWPTLQLKPLSSACAPDRASTIFGQQYLASTTLPARCGRHSSSSR